MKLKLKAKLLDIGTGGPLVALIDDEVAAQLDVFAGDRVKLACGNRDTICLVNIAKRMSHDEVGIFYEVAKLLKIRKGQHVIVSPENRPDSVPYIRSKLEGEKLSYEQIKQIITDTSENNLTDAELAYFVSGAFTKGFTMKETYYLTKTMIDLGDRLKWNNKFVASKHCVGGIAGNRTTMMIVPIITAAGLLMPKTSSRSITSPAGTADTMEVLTNVNFKDIKEIKKVVAKTNGCIVWGGALQLAPADDKIIKVEHPLSLDPTPMLLASIMAKKASEGATHVIIDIPVGKFSKIGNGGLYRELKSKFEKLGGMLGIKVKVVRSSAEGPIGRGFGPVLEARDVLWALKGDPEAPKDLVEKSIRMAGVLLEMGGKASFGGGEKLARKLLTSGAAYRKMQEIIKAQGGDPYTDPNELEPAKMHHVMKSPKTGRVSLLNDDVLARAARLAGAPRDKGAGIYMHVDVGKRVKKRDKLFTIYSESDFRLDEAFDYAEKNKAVLVK